jgi:predicted NAD/FAD-dependent oxidoreductase
MLQAEVVVIGAGLSGLTFANRLALNGHDVICLEKARGTGGRLSSKRMFTDNNGTLAFDLGASAFRVQSASFQSFLTQQNHVVDVDNNQFVPVSRSSALTRFLAQGIRLEVSTKIIRIERYGNTWRTFERLNNQEVLCSESQFLVLAIPPEQAYQLLPDVHSYKTYLGDVTSQPQWVSIFLISNEDFNESVLNKQSKIQLQFESDDVKQVVVESLKPGRSKPESGYLVKIEASPIWSQSRTDLDPQSIQDMQWNILAGLLWPEDHYCCKKYLESFTHRWLYSLPQESALSQSLYDLNKYSLAFKDELALCGDYLAIRDQIEGVESAFLSGNELAEDFLSIDRALKPQ